MMIPQRKPLGMAGPLAPEPSPARKKPSAGPLLSPEFRRQMAVLNGRHRPAPTNVGQALHGLGRDIKQDATLGFLRRQDEEQTAATNELYGDFADSVPGATPAVRALLAGPGATADTRRIGVQQIGEIQRRNAPLSEMDQLNLEVKRAQLEKLRRGPVDEYAQRSKAFIDAGGVEGSEGHRQFTLTGRMATPADPLDRQLKIARLESLRSGQADPFEQRDSAVTRYGDGLTPEQKTRFRLTGKLPGQDQGNASEYQQREAAGVRMGLEPGSPDLREYVLTGKLPKGAAPSENVEHARNIKAGLENLNATTNQEGFDASVGPLQGGDATFLGAPFRVANDALSDGNQREIRAKIEGDARALSVAVKKIARGAGEGTFTDADQRLLDQMIGDLSGAHDVAEYNRRLSAVRDRIEANFGIKIGPLSFENGQKRLPRSGERRLSAPEQRQVGETVTTAKGTFRWAGDGWESVQ